MLASGVYRIRSVGLRKHTDVGIFFYHLVRCLATPRIVVEQKRVSRLFVYALYTGLTEPKTTVAMNKQHLTSKQSYVSPEIQILEMSAENSLLVGSNEDFGEQSGVMQWDDSFSDSIFDSIIL